MFNVMISNFLKEKQNETRTSGKRSGSDSKAATVQSKKYGL